MRTNEDRIASADTAIRTLHDEISGDFGHLLRDMLTNLMHWADHQGLDFSAACDRAWKHYEQEVNEGVEQPGLVDKGEEEKSDSFQAMSAIDDEEEDPEATAAVQQHLDEQKTL